MISSTNFLIQHNIFLKISNAKYNKLKKTENKTKIEDGCTERDQTKMLNFMPHHRSVSPKFTIPRMNGYKLSPTLRTTLYFGHFISVSGCTDEFLASRLNIEFWSKTGWHGLGLRWQTKR